MKGSRASFICAEVTYTLWRALVISNHYFMLTCMRRIRKIGLSNAKLPSVVAIAPVHNRRPRAQNLLKAANNQPIREPFACSGRCRRECGSIKFVSIVTPTKLSGWAGTPVTDSDYYVYMTIFLPVSCLQLWNPWTCSETVISGNLMRIRSSRRELLTC